MKMKIGVGRAALWGCIVGVVMCAQVTRGGMPEVTFTPDTGVRLTGWWPHLADIVAQPSGGFRMYHSDSYGPANYPIVIRSAVSADGLAWTKESGMRLGQGVPGSESWCTSGDTLVLPDASLRMYYSSEDHQSIAAAVSTDGLAWTPQGVVLAKGTSNDNGGMMTPYIVQAAGGWRMYYAGYNGAKGRRVSP